MLSCIPQTLLPTAPSLPEILTGLFLKSPYFWSFFPFLFPIFFLLFNDFTCKTRGRCHLTRIPALKATSPL